MRDGRIYLYPGSSNTREYQSPFTIGTWEDLKALGIVPEEGMRLAFYDDDADDDGKPDDLIFEGIAHFEPSKGWIAIIDASTLRHESDERNGK